MKDRTASELANISDHEPMTLTEACLKHYGGHIKPATLRAEHKRGNLTFEAAGRKHMVTGTAIKEMRAKKEIRTKWGVTQSPLGSGFNPLDAPATAASSNAPSGASEIARQKSARAAAKESASKLKKRLLPT